MQVEVRRMSAADVPRACRILNDIVRTGGTTAIEAELTEEKFAADFLAGDSQVACHVALDSDGDVAGFQWLGRNDGLPPDCADIATFARRNPSMRGTGRALFGVTCKYAVSAGIALINATIRADNMPGLRYYSKMGFVDYSVQRGVPLDNGRPVDRVSKRFKLDRE